MSKRFVINEVDKITEQSFTDMLTKKVYSVSCFDDIVELVNFLYKYGEMEFIDAQERHLYQLSVFQEYAQKYEYDSEEHKLIRDIGVEIGLPVTILGDINNRADNDGKVEKELGKR